MFYYKLYDLVLSSKVEISKLVETEGEEFDIELSFRSVGKDIRKFVTEGKLFGKKKNAFWFSNEHAIFLIEDGKTIVVDSIDGANVEKTIPFILGYCMSFVLAQRGAVAIHSSAVAINNRGIVIAGYSGSGKSSLTTQFIENGYNLLADDVSVIQKNESERYITPAFPMQNLCTDLIEQYKYDKNDMTLVDHKRNKYTMERSNVFSYDSKRIEAMFVLKASDVDTVKLNLIHGSEKVKFVINNLFLRPAYKSTGLPEEIFKECIEIANDVRIYELIRPLYVDTTKIQMDMIMNTIKT